YFNSFLMNTGKWQGKKWTSIGIGIKENYACAWFGELPDPEGEPFICGQEPQKTVLPPLDVKSEQEKKKPEPKVELKNKNPKIIHPDTTKKTIPPDSNVKPETIPVDKETYFIIVKGIAPEQELKLYLKNLQLKGYKNSRLIEKNGKQRVSIMEFKEKSKADSALRQVKITFPDAWILKQ
ncbi:MAG: SPOR domain-containing protein, partial [Bacteroidales bacterium]